MHGLGNDFIIVDNLQAQYQLSKSLIQQMAHRKTGIGFDQLLLLEASYDKNADFCYRIFNADGNEVEHCGNGARCIAYYVDQNQLINKPIIRFKIKDRILFAHLDKDQITINMGLPSINPSEIVFPGKQDQQQQVIQIDQQSINFYLVCMGNPHAVIFSKPEDKLDIKTIGEYFNQPDQFKSGINVSLAEIESTTSMKLQVYERGSGLTTACGTAACAAVAIGKQLGQLETTVTVSQPGGDLVISWPNQQKDLMMSGGANHVFDGCWAI